METFDNEDMLEEASGITPQASSSPFDTVARAGIGLRKRMHSAESWKALTHRFSVNAFTPSFRTGKWSHPAFSYLAASLLQVVAVIAITLLLRVFPSFPFTGMLVILVVLFVALNWGVGPSLIATLSGAVLLIILLLSPSFSLHLTQTENALGLGLYLVVGFTVSILASRQARHSAEELHTRLDTIIDTIPDPLSIHEAQGTMTRLNSAAMQAEMEARLALLQLILDELPSSVYLVNERDARLVLANRTSTRVWGASWPVGQPMSDFLQTNGIRIYGIDGRPLAPEQYATLRAVQQGEMVRQQQEIIRHPDGTTLPVLVNAVALDAHNLKVSLPHMARHPDDGSERAALVVHQDVSALKETERLKDDFIGLVAHELRNPLAILKGFEQTLIIQTAKGKGPELADWQKEALQGIDSVTLHLVELTEDLLDVTRLQAGRLVLHLEPTDLVALSERVVTRLQRTTDQHTISLFSSLDHLVIPVDARRIEQVLSNLINNAIKYSPEGGSIEVTVREDPETHDALLSVCDQGIGIPAHQQANIFSRFARADNAGMYGISGTGLGLYLSRELIEQHGGRVWFESAEGVGSTFFIALPVTSKETHKVT